MTVSTISASCRRISSARSSRPTPRPTATETLYETEPTHPGLWNGPYLVSEISSGSHVVLDRNPLWWGKSPAIDRIIVRSIENTSALEANLLAGEVDMIEGSLGLSLDQAIAFEERNGDRFEVFYKPGLIYEHLDLMLDNPILADKRVRKALIHAIDRETLSQQLFGGRQPVAHTSINPLDWIYDENVTRYAFDPDQARALLDEAGWSDLRGGVRHDAGGNPLQLTLMTTAGNRTRELVQQVLQSYWKQVGVDVRIENEPARVFFGETVNKRRFTGNGALRLDIGTREHAAHDALFERDPQRRQWLVGTELYGLPELTHGRIDRRPSRSSSTGKPAVLFGVSCRPSMPRSCLPFRFISAPTPISGPNG